MTKERRNAGGRKFGEGLQVSIFSLTGKSNESICNEVTHRIIEAIQMNVNGLSPKVWKYPMNDGKGGVGITFVQPLVESFIAWDTWEDHNGAFIFIVSCKEYDVSLVDSILSEYFDVKQKDLLLTEL